MVTARVSNSRGGRVPSLSLQTPPQMRHKKHYVQKIVTLGGGYRLDVSGFVDHSIAWKRRSHRTADQYNSAVTCLDKPCLRRWLEFTGQRVPKNLNYAYHSPPNITSNPVRVWSLVSDSGPVATFTNLGEAYLVMLGFHTFGDEYDYRVIYTDFSG